MELVELLIVNCFIIVVFVVAHIKREAIANKIKTMIEKGSSVPHGVSEPVISFVQEFKTNKRRFKVDKRLIPNAYINWIVEDLREGVIFKFNHSLPARIETPILMSAYQDDKPINWLSLEEKDYLYNELICKRGKRYKELQEIRKQRRHKRERDTMKKLYCKEKS